MKSVRIQLVLQIALLLTCGAALPAAEITIATPDSPLLRFALGKLEAALQRQGHTLRQTSHLTPESGPRITVVVDPTAAATIGPEDFHRTKLRQGLKITACGERGAMYGLLDLAQEIRLGTPIDRIPDRTTRARFEFRAIKFNLPWSAYRTSPALEQHQETCKDLRFWEAFLDMMAENRFNVLTLWSLHPYTYMIRPRNFPEACPFGETELAEWKKLWSGIFAMAKERALKHISSTGISLSRRSSPDPIMLRGGAPT